MPCSRGVSPSALCSNASMSSGMSSGNASQQVLVTVTGSDHPGITAALTAVVAERGAVLLDIEQVVVHGQLILALVLGLDGDDNKPVLKDLLFEAKSLGLTLEFKVLPVATPAKSHPPRRYAITAVSDRIEASAVHVVSKVLAEFNLNMETIKQLSDGRLGCFEVIASSFGQVFQARSGSTVPCFQETPDRCRGFPSALRASRLGSRPSRAGRRPLRVRPS